MNYLNLYNQLKNKLIDSVKRNSAEGILFSGGLDTSILMAIEPRMIGIHISLKDYGSDTEYAKSVEDFLNSIKNMPDLQYAYALLHLIPNRENLKIHYRKIKINETLNAIPNVIKILKSFDPAIPNDMAVYFGLKFAKELKIKSIITGDGSDELFAGYSYMRNINNLDNYIQQISKKMYFSSNKIGKYFGIEIKQPYMDKEFRDFSLEIPAKLKIKKENRKIFGKWVLRKAFEDLLPKKIIWQNKRPLEYGSGMTKLREIISNKISDEEFIEKQKIYQIKFFNKEHLYYYEIYKNVVGEIPKPKNNQKKCPGCGAGIEYGCFHCRICGYVINL